MCSPDSCLCQRVIPGGLRVDPGLFKLASAAKAIIVNWPQRQPESRHTYNVMLHEPDAKKRCEKRILSHLNSSRYLTSGRTASGSDALPPPESCRSSLAARPWQQSRAVARVDDCPHCCDGDEEGSRCLRVLSEEVTAQELIVKELKGKYWGVVKH